MDKNYEIDNVDMGILDILTKDAKKPFTEVARKVYVSGGTVHVRMNKMEDAGIVLGSTLDLDYAKLGYTLTAFLGIYLSKSSLYDEVFEKLTQIDEITSELDAAGCDTAGLLDDASRPTTVKRSFIGLAQHRRRDSFQV